MTRRSRWGQGPSIEEMVKARESVEWRRAVDELWADFCGLSDDERGPFMARLKLYDLREQVRQEQEAVDDLEHVRLRRDLRAFWMDDEMREREAA